MSSAASAASPASLKVTTSPRPGSRLALEVAVPAGRSQSSYDAALAKLSRSIKLPGFRKGKVPQPVLLQQIGPLRVRATALEDLVDAVFRDALAQEEIPAIGQPELAGGFEALLERFAPGEELTISYVEEDGDLRARRGALHEYGCARGAG
jgi:trigger factor